MSNANALIEQDVAARREANRERRIADARAAEQASAMAVATAPRPGNGAPPEMEAVREVRLLGKLLYGRRWQADVVGDLGENVRQVRRWVAGEATPREHQVAFLRRRARDRAKAILSLVGDRL